MKRFVGLFILGSVMFIGCSDQNMISPLVQIKEDVIYLSSDSLEGRETGTPGAELAAAYIQGRFESLGLEPKGEDGTWFQSFSYKPHPPVQKHEHGDSVSLGMAEVKEVIGKNVVGFLDNHANKTIIIGAHFDHLGWGDENSLNTGERAIHNGADDNASGVSAMLYLAEKYAQHPMHSNVLFIGFSGEEKGLWGSNHFSKNPTIDFDQVNYMLNMDMVGRLNEDRKLAINGVGTSPSWIPLLDSIRVDSIDIVTTESGIGPSDHTSFYLQDIPVLHFFTGQHEDYHKPTDDFDKINYEGVLSVATYLDAVVQALDNEDKLEFTKTKDEDNESTPSFNVTLGVIPDYLFDGIGMRIDGAHEGRPASNAGMVSGDIVIQLGDNEVTDMKTYMHCLSIFTPGDSTEAKILRDGEELKVLVVWD